MEWAMEVAGNIGLEEKCGFCSAPAVEVVSKFSAEAFCAEHAAEVKSLHREPPAGSWASVARMMAAGDESGFDWDAWKEEMKEAA